MSAEHTVPHVQSQQAEMSPALRVDRVALRYGAIHALDDVSFDVARGSILCLLGASGSGKSSVLRVIAGLERPASGQVSLDGRLVAGHGVHIEPEQRRVGMVFQDFALFPHLSVADNVGFGIRGWKRSEIRRTVDSLLSDIGLVERRESYPHMLSGGERQRVALVRALAPKPRLLLMDEPFSSLDARLRERIREQTMALLRRTATTTILVTHDPLEAMRVADHVGVLSRGRLEQCGTPAEIYDRPRSPLVAALFDDVNTIEGTVRDGVLETPLGSFPVAREMAQGTATVCLRPQHLHLASTGPGVHGAVTEITRVGSAVEVRIRVAGCGLLARVAGPTDIGVGDTPCVRVDPVHLSVFPRTSTPSSAFAS